MAFPSTQSRPFAPLGSSTSPTLNGTTSSASYKSSLGNGTGPWGSKTASIWGNGNVPNALASRASATDKAQPGSSSNTDALGDSALKKGSGSLLATSESDTWRPSQPRSTSRPAVTTHPLRTTSTIEIPRVYNSGSATISPTASRPPTVNLTNPAFPHARPAFGSSHTSATFGGEPPNVYPKYKDRQTPSSYTPADSVVDHASAAPSPTSERRPQWPTQYSNPTSVSTSREPSRPPHSLHTDRHYSVPSIDSTTAASRYSPHFHSSMSPSTRNGSLSSIGNMTEQLASSFANLNVRQNERPSSSRSLPPGTHIVANDGLTNGYFEPLNDIDRLVSGQQPLGSRNGLSQYGVSSPTTTQQQPSQQQQHHSSSLTFSLHDLQTSDFRPGHNFVMPNYQNGQFQHTAQQMPWQDVDTSPTTIVKRLPQTPDPQFLFDSRSAAQMMAIKNQYALQGAFGTSLAMPMANLPPFLSYYPSGLGSVPPTLPAPEVEQGLQSAKLFEFKMAGKNTRRYELKDIYEHVAEFAGDQHGSRFIQTKLETANSDEKERVFREIEPNAIPLMTDVFGNYVIQKFFDHGHQEHKKILANKMRGQVLNLSTQMYGCRVVQKALEHVLLEQQAALVNELKHHVLKCVKDQNGNHVIQKVIERCSADSISFVYDAFIGQVHTLSLHPYGCRVIQRCLERTEWFPAKPTILAELHESVPKGMIGDSYGNYVVQHIVQNGPPPDRQHVLGIVLSDVEGYSKHKFASNVVEKCIEYSDDRWRRQVVDIFTKVDHRRPEYESILVSLIKDQYGNYVIQRLLDRLPMQDYVFFHHQLQPAMAHAKRTGSGKQVVSIEKKMQRSDIVPALHDFQAPAAPLLFNGHYSSANSSAPLSPLTANNHSMPNSSSVSGDAVEGATSMSRTNSEVTNELGTYRQ